ncbi:MAG: UDP-N-acetylmuramoyl-L-alanine--D-glutamate ligase [Candidatus Pacebacteria bacterium]|nr:UDP-N-acetylmuramoyl-L-alanine--D-glutamate ligase [Candidatus Paceibacterota bacterium]
MSTSWYTKYFKDKKITVMGIGLLGRGVGDIKFLASCGADIIATDLKSEEKLKKSLRQLKRYKNISYTLNKHSIGDFRGRDMIIKGSGVPLENKYIDTAESENIPVHMSFGLVMDILAQEGIEVTVIGITGSKGKSTTTGLIQSILEASGLPYHIAGNVRGVANLPLLKKVKSGDIILAELDSWQLQGLHKVKRSPNVAVFTNFFEDHLNYYQGSMRKYFKDKSAIFKYQNEEDILILTSGSAKAIKKYYKQKNIKSKKHISRFKHLPKSWEYTIFGKHNEKNIAQAYTVGKELGIPQSTIKTALTEFKGVEGRFQHIGTSKNNILFFNDNNSTTPESTVKSLQSLKKKYPERDIILIGGGADKEFHYQKMAKYVARNIHFTLLFSGGATDKLRDCFPSRFEKFTETLSMKTAFNIALSHAEPGSIVILSPGAASFGVFNNEYERGDQYIKQVKKFLKK